MKIIKESEINILELVNAFKQGKIVVYPTETSYGLGCDSTNKAAVDKIFKIKKRQKDKPLLVVVPDLDMMIPYIVWSKNLAKISEKFWPGAVTAVVYANKDIPLAKGILAEDGTVAFRVTSHHLAEEISQKLGHPIAATSANISGMGTPYSINDVIKMFEKEENKPDIIIDAGDLPYKTPSTIVKITQEEVEVLRQGEIIINLS